MATIVTRTVGGAGPYVYRVEYVDGEHEWEYLGPVEEVDLADVDLGGVEQATIDELQAMVDDRDDSATDPEPRPETTRIEFHDRNTANAIRDQIADEWLADDDDRRKKTVELTDDAPLAVENLVSGEAADSRAHLADKGGQIPLTDAEKREIDFSRTNVMHARSVKGKMSNAGVDDWLMFYEPQLEVDEHDAEAAKRDERGARMDADDTEAAEIAREAEAHRKAQSQAEDHARKACIDGHDEACAELERLGWSQAEIEQLEQYTEPETFARVVNDEQKRAGAA